MGAQLPAPEPAIGPESAEFWAATLEGRLLLGFCDSCLTYFWYPRPLCPACGTWGARLRESAGLGEVVSYTRVHRGLGEYAEVGVYVVGYVQLDEGPRLLTNLVDVSDDLRIGDRVAVVFHKTDGPAALPRFRPASEPAHSA
ncbi:nucleotide-binding protein [Kribbella sandramycini]|uniref:Nucleotide-binding protein n=1 Tax=Kribbella sandramycini TaxID=60450 RepID=A0A7Y4KXG1_9ACTN|nr:OB-fold domain-containing protein [Kribbella sandramycini]MBB6567733.1 putative OB-fold protein [Kribbella sandramycini]NOL39671.1 nucleotide-binding protein [Kribbella sandramycini]